MLEITKKSKFGAYFLKDTKTKKEYELIFQFFGIEPQIGDKLLIFEELLNKKYEGFCQPYAFEACKNTLEDFFKSENEEDFAVLSHNGKKTLLKRIYG